MSGKSIKFEKLNNRAGGNRRVFLDDAFADVVTAFFAVGGLAE